MSRSSLVLCLCLLVAAAGCSLLNEPDRDKLEPADGGMDAPMDAPMDSPMDGGMDGDAGDGSMCTAFESDCDNNVDDDCDGLTDCADFECANAMKCCGAGTGTPTIEEDWMGGFDDWDVSPAGVDDPRAMDGTLVNFRETEDPVALRSTFCVSLALGLDLHTTFRPVSTDTEDSFAAIVVTPSDEVVAGNRLTDDLAVELSAGGMLKVTQNGEALAVRTEPIASGELVDIDIAITPGLQGSQPAIFATVIVDGNADDPLVDRALVVRQDQLLDDRSGCEDVAGLFVGVEGLGDGVQVGGVEATARRCVNPRQFGRPADMTEDDVVTPAQLTSASGPSSAVDRFVDGGFAAPALISTCESGGDPCWDTPSNDHQWDVLYEGTNVDMTLGTFTHVGYSIGHSRATNWDADWASHGGDVPKIGHDPPTCLTEPPDGGMGECADARSHRDPTAFPFQTSTDRVLGTRPMLGAYARELESEVTGDGGVRDRFGIHVVRLASELDECTDPAPAGGRTCEDPVETPTLAPGDACVSVRDPELVPRTAPAEGGGELTHNHFWLLYTCERTDGGRDVRVARLDTSGGIVIEDEAPHPVVLPPEDGLGSYADGGVRAAEAVIDFAPADDDEARTVVRVWFVAQDASGERTIALAQGEVDGDGGGFPSLVEFPANPVLDVEADVLGGCPDDCTLLGFDVVSRADNPPSEDTPLTLRFLVARRVNDGSGVSHEMVPLEQSWKPR